MKSSMAGRFVRYLCVTVLLMRRCFGGPKPLYIGGFFPISGDGFPVAPVALPAVELALEAINNSTHLLPDYHLYMHVYDTEHSPSVGMRRFLDMINGEKTTIFMVGPAISSVSIHVGVAAASWNLVQISFAAHTSDLEDRELYPFFFRTIPSDAMLNPLRLQTIRHFGWTRVAIIYEDHPGNVYYASLPSLVDDLRRDGVDVLVFESVKKDDYAATIRKLKRLDARIIIGHFFFLMAEKVFCEAYRQGLYGPQYVWLLPGWAGAEWWSQDSTDPVYNCTAQQLTAAQDGHFSANYVSYTSDNTSVLGMTVKEFRDKMEERAGTSSEYSAYAFDAMISVGHVLHKASRDLGLNLSEFTYDSDNFSAVFVEELYKLQFVGISGPVGFDVRGNRLGVSVLEQSQGGNRRLVGRLEPRSSHLHLDTDSIVWLGNRQPRDGPLRSRTARFLPLSATVIISGLSALGFVVACAFITFNFKFSELQYIKLSSPNMNTVVSVGCSLGYLSVVMFGLDGRQLSELGFTVICHVRLLVLCVAYSLAFGALFFKTWRVHRIMANKRLEKIRLKDRHLLGWIGGFVALDLLFLCTWMAVDPLDRSLAPLPLEVDIEDSDHILEPFIEKCTCQHEGYWLGAMLVYKGLLLLFGLFLAWETRNIQVQALNDSKYIGMSVYNLAVICVVGVPVGFVINDEYFVGNYIISAFFIMIAVTITLCFVFVPKLHAVYHNPDGHVDVRFLAQSGLAMPVSGQTTATAGDTLTVAASTSRVTPLSQIAHNIALQHRMEKMIAERDHHISQLQKELRSFRLSTDSAIQSAI